MGMPLCDRRFSRTSWSVPRARRPPSSVIRHVETTWQLQDNPRGQIYLYSAYYDDRPLASVVPTVKVLTMSSFYKDISGYCHVWYESEEQPYVVKASVNQTSVSFYIERNRELAGIHIHVPVGDDETNPDARVPDHGSVRTVHGHDPDRVRVPCEASVQLRAVLRQRSRSVQPRRDGGVVRTEHDAGRGGNQPLRHDVPESDRGVRLL